MRATGCSQIQPVLFDENQLCVFKLIKRKVYAEIPPRVEYSLTSAGKELRTALLPLVRWMRQKEE
jgi:DNA-binding HxlR family transcriptional regulator